MKIAIGCDHTGIALKEALKTYLDSRMIPYEFLAFTEEHRSPHAKSVKQSFGALTAES